MPLLQLKELSVEFVSAQTVVRAVDNVSLDIEPGECVCLVGESGCGKTATALSIAQLLPSPPARYTGGEIRLEGRDVLRLTRPELRSIRGGVVGYVFQEPGVSLNPVLRIDHQIRETLKLHRPARNTSSEVLRVLNMVGIPEPEARARAYPFQLSGGLQQRVMMAIALAAEPRLLVADEPTTALDVTIQAQLLELLQRLRRELGMAVLLITHNLAIVKSIADRVAVMYAGQIVESGPAAELLCSPRHPYTKALLNSVPRLVSNSARLASIPGTVPHGAAWPPGCRFAPRCPLVQAACAQSVPELLPANSGCRVRCPYAKTDAPPYEERAHV